MMLLKNSNDNWVRIWKLMEVFMNKEWAEMNKTLQLQIKKNDTFAMGIDTLLELRRTLMELLWG